MEGRYGRLFTEGDVRVLLADAYERGRRDESVGEAPPSVVHEGVGKRLLEEAPERDFRPTFPADEPLFLLRGQDKAAPAGAAHYAREAHVWGAAREFCEAARKASMEMTDWQAEHPDRVKVPD